MDIPLASNYGGDHGSPVESRETILVVDDNEELAWYLAKKLLPSFGYKTLQASTGRAGLDLIRKARPALVLLDLQLPDMDGLELLRILARDGISIPAILSTGHGSEQVAVEAFRLGVQDYLSKPVQPQTLKQAIHRIFSQAKIQNEKTRLTLRLQEQVAWLTTLFQVGQSVTSTLEINEVLRRIVEAGVYLTKAEEGFLALIDGKSGQLYLRASKNIEAQRTLTMRLQITDTIIGEVIRSKKPIRISRKKEDSILKVCTGYLVSSLLHVPILSKNEALGVLSIDHQDSFKSFTDSDEFLLTSLAAYAAIALENASLFERSQTEVIERLRAETALRESEERYALAVMGTNDGIWDWDLTTNQIYYSPRWKSILGYGEEEIDSTPEAWFARVHPEDRKVLKMAISAHLQSRESHFEYEHRMLHKDGTYRWILTRGFSVKDANGRSSRMSGSQSDITDRKLAEERLIHNAFYDTLTSLPNRALLLDRLRQAISRKKRWPDKNYYVLYLDLDQFKNVNDSLGHETGDRLLIAVASSLKANLRNMDTVARFGGDEFILLIEDIQDQEEIRELAQRILQDLSKPFNLNGHEMMISASIGIVSGEIEYEDPEQLLRDADITMYSAKARGRNRFEIFQMEMRNDFLDQLFLEYALRNAIQEEELQLAYQPIISLATGELYGFEALIRWDHPINGPYNPKDFIRLAEERGLIVAIDRWVLKHACLKISDWLKDFPGFPDLAISVNISVKSLQQLKLVEVVGEILQKTGLDGRHLKLEITESGVMENNHQIRSILYGLQSMGVDIYIDDFGTGYSSLVYLHQFPVQVLKIDQYFIGNLHTKEHMPGFIRTVLHLAHDLGLKVIAEGVENEVQLEKLKELGCEYGQGYFISKPLTEFDAAEILKLIQSGLNTFAIHPISQEDIPVDPWN